MTTIANLNDAFRKAGPGILRDNGWIITRGVAARDPVFQIIAARAVREFTAFTPDNDPYGEHDFGSFEIDGTKLFWKIDCYDANDMTMGSPDPANPSQTHRIMTIMLASEF